MTKLFVSICLLFLVSFTAFSQKIITTLPIDPHAKDTLSNWTKKNKIGFDISEIAFVNWNAGGTSSISGLLKTQFKRIYTKDNYNWSNELIMRYGLNKQDGIELRKTDDVFQFNSAFGYRNDTISNWYHTAKFNFNTQFTNGYAYPNKEISVSKPFAPAYVFLGLGAEYATKKKDRMLYLSPFTSKMTFVLDQRLANLGTFGVVKAVYDSSGNLVREGEKSKIELGFLLTAYYKKEIVKNVTIENKLSLYSDYINRFGNVDIDYDLSLDLIVNSHIRTNIGAHFIYDDDIKAKENIDGTQITVGPKLQLKQVLGVGIVYLF
ncbi:DUF3078 domain-containing protein [Flavobacterium muglaense]|uniref:DUF3078 domain-containing protein n=1 Tax=Flavobacterium muglaense TaxID=2764716 RepID=A0A923N0P7_9FLAO|nr:DUF3078 domain-containing protein [Flavobacterium muglaense]MBC5837934.1 DUF3078 domain-containing protein [Flavobacterium muglaense]MBC5844504.1 DUF3078 domain-containing protein [Flavobacterium muglaense]